MARQYLLRRSLESYLGPMTLPEMIQAYRRLEFGLQDEIAGSCGEWVALDDVNRLKRAYPDVAKVVTEELLGGWGVSDHSQQQMLKKSSRKRSSKKPRSPFFLAVFLGGLFLAFVAVKSGKVPSRLVDRIRSPSTDAVSVYLQNGDESAFQDSMEEMMPSLLPRVSKSRKMYNEWIPYLRAFAFQRNGTIEGFSAKLLRGMENYAAPQDCSQQAWTQIWRDSDSKWADVIDGKVFEASAWVQVMLWDPLWLARRRGSSGWIEPASYYEGCLRMARKALSLHEGKDVKAEVVRELDARLQSVMLIAQRQRPDSRQTSSRGVLGYLACLERAVGHAALAGCHEPKNISPEWKSYLGTARARTELYVFLRNKVVLTDDELGVLSKLQARQLIKDPMTLFNYDAELSFVAAVIQNNGSLREAAKRTQYEFPEVQLVE